MWIDAHGDLWMPAAQLNKTAGYNGGRSAVRQPLAIYVVHIGVGPSAIDHG